MIILERDGTFGRKDWKTSANRKHKSTRPSLPSRLGATFNRMLGNSLELVSIPNNALAMPECADFDQLSSSYSAAS